MTIDPGISGTGYAVWQDDILKDHGVITYGYGDWYCKTQAIAKKLSTYANFYKIKKAHIEYPAKFGGAGGDMVAAAGDLVKLAFFVGYTTNALGCPVELVEVIKWKGQLPKEIVKQRIKKLIPNCKATSHDFDAIGIGLYTLGRF